MCNIIINLTEPMVPDLTYFSHCVVLIIIIQIYLYIYRKKRDNVVAQERYVLMHLINHYCFMT